MKIKMRVNRFDPSKDSKPHIQEYEVEAEPADRVLDALHYIKGELDGTLAFRRSCGHGTCGSDAMVINGVNRLACKTLIKDLRTPITIEPIRGLTVEKDLIVNMKPFFEAYKQVKPYLINDESPAYQERPQSPEERAVFDDTTKCILCAACTTSCPAFWANGEYVGPAAIVNAHRFIFDSRDKGASERLDILNRKSGVWRCRTIFNCVEACPREIKITQAIEEVKRAILFEKL